MKLGDNFEIDLDRLISTRMLIQANSGGGKSYAIRKLLEESHGKVQQIVIDLEGEFSTLREKYDYLLVGQNGEIPARIQTAELLAKKLLKINVSTIIDLSELKHHERILFVKRFLDSLVNAPKELWHPCLVVVDEAHQFCPEKSKSEAGSSVIDLCTRGRKRGYCAILATQRISKLNKDAAAECNNKMVGRTLLDIDQKRAADTLGIIDKNEIRNLRNMEDGEFKVFGPAIGREVKRILVGKTKTTHLDSKNILLAPTPTPKNIEKIMKDVIDLPKEAEDELKDMNDYKNKVIELNREVRRLEHIQTKPVIQSDEKALNQAELRGTKRAENHYQEEIKARDKLIKNFERKMKQIADILSVKIVHPDAIVKITEPIVPTIRPVWIDPKIKELAERTGYEDEIKLALAEKKIYNLLLEYPDKIFSKRQIGVYTGYAWKGGGFNNSLGKLNTLGLIIRKGDTVQIKVLRPELAGNYDFSIKALISKLAKCEREIYEVLLESPHEQFTKEEVAERTPSNYNPLGGGFNNSIGKLNTLGLIERDNGFIKINPEILEL